MSDDIRALLSPSSIAIVGASADTNKFGGRLVEILQVHGFPGEIYPINPRRSEIFGLKAFPRLRAVPGKVDVAVLCVPQAMILDALDDCGTKGVALCIIISAQFAEAGPEGRALEERLQQKARHYGVRILGPNCLGFISRANKIVLTPSPALYAHVPMPEGRIGMVSQSGGLLATMFDIAAGLGLGFTHGVTVGNQLDITAADIVRFLADDPETRVICCYLEGVKDFPDFARSLARAKAAGKPVVILKAGRTAEGGAAAFTHTASLASDYEIFAAHVEEMGAVMVDDPRILLIVADLLDRYGAPTFADVVIVTNSGGGAAIMADRLHDAGLPMRQFGEPVTRRLSEFYFASHARNPLDWGGSDLASEDELLEKSFAALAREPGNPFLVIVFVTNPNMKRTAEILASHVERAGLPYLFLVVPDRSADVSRDVLRQRRMPFCDGFDDALRAVAALKRHGHRHRGGSPVIPAGSAEPLPPPGAVAGDGILGAAATQGLLSGSGISVASASLAATCEEAARMADGMGYPVALKLVAEGVAHKSDVGGVELGIGDAAELCAAWGRIAASLRRRAPDRRIDGMLVQPMVEGEVECFIGVKCDPAIGPIVMFGAGGILVEMLRDRAVLAAPCSPNAVKQRLAELSVAKLLAGYRGRPGCDVDALMGMIVRVSVLAHGLRDRLVELDLNPVIVGAEGRGAVAVDARARFRPEDHGPPPFPSIATEALS